MKAYNKIYEANQYNNLKDVIGTSTKLYPDNNAFIIKQKNGKDITYKHITYKKFQEDINSLGTSLCKDTLENKRFAIIGKNRYEWILTYLAVMNGNGITVPLDKGLKEEEIISCLLRSKADSIVFEKEYLDIIKKAKENKDIQIRQYICMDDIQEEGVILLSNLLEEGSKLIKERE